MTVPYGVVDFIFVVIEFFRYLLRFRRYERKSVEVGFFRRGGSLWAHISERREKIALRWYQSSRVIVLSCGIKMSAVRHLVLSQSTRVTDGETDGRTIRQTDGLPKPPSHMLARENVNKLHFQCTNFNSPKCITAYAECICVFIKIWF